MQRINHPKFCAKSHSDRSHTLTHYFRQFSSFFIFFSKVCMHPTRIDLLLLLSLSLITELLSHTSLPLVCFCFSFCVSDALSRDTSRSSCASPRCQSFFGFVILSSFFLGLQLCRYAHALSCSSFLLATNSLSSHSVSVVNIDFFSCFFLSLRVLDIYILYPPTTTGGGDTPHETSRDSMKWVPVGTFLGSLPALEDHFL